MKEGFAIYIVTLLRSDDMQHCIEVLSSLSEFKQIGDTTFAYLDDRRDGKGKTVNEVRDYVTTKTNDKAHVIVAYPYNLSWFLDKETSEWLKEYK